MLTQPTRQSRSRDPSFETAAKVHCVEQGWADHELTLAGFETSAKISGSKGMVRLRANRQNQEKSIRIELRKGLYASKWQVVEYEESEIDDGPRDAMR